MTDYKLVPVEPTAKMVEVAQEAYMPFGDMEMAIRMALLSAPAVQGEPLFRFNARAVESDPTGYYMTRWDRAQPVTVVAHTRDEAFEKVRTMMGDPTRHGAWAVRIDSAEEIVNDNQ